MEHKIVRKSNALVEASYKLTAQEQWVVLFLTSMIKNHDEDFKDYSLSIKDFSELAGLQHKGEYKEVKEITKKLIGRVFTINEPSGPLQISWLSSAKYIKGEGTVTLRFDPNLKPYLLQLKNRFTKYNLYLVMQLKSSFSIRIYELLKQHENFKERSFLVEDLREMLGIDPAEYPKYGNFKQKVLNVAQKELGEKTDIAFEYEETKVGRGVGKIRFIIKAQAKTKRTLPLSDAIVIEKNLPKPENPELLRLFELIPQEFCKEIVKKLIQSVFEKNGFDYVLRNIVYTNEKSNAVKPGSNAEKGSNYRVYLSKALHEDYGLAYHEDRESKKESEEKHHKAVSEAEKKKNQEMAVIRIEQENREKARAFMKSVAQETVKNFEVEAQKRLSSDSLKRYERGDSIGLFEFKRKMEDVVMEHMGISKPSAKTEKKQEAKSPE